MTLLNPASNESLLRDIYIITLHIASLDIIIT